MFLRLLAVSVIAVAAAIANHTTNTNLLLASRTSPTELAYGGPIELVDQGAIVAVDGIRVHRSISGNLHRLLNAARNDGIRLSGWGWRSHRRQHELRLINGCPDGWIHRPGERPTDFAPSSRCRVPTARPGRSMHETGLAVDFTYRGSVVNSRSSPAYRWLAANAARYGFYNLPSEPWHWSINGR